MNDADAAELQARCDCRAPEVAKAMTIFTIGHSNHPAEAFAALLALHRITALADVRSVPYSRVNPQYNREMLAATLESCGIVYVHLGRDLGGRSNDANCYDDEGRIRYDRVARTARFADGIERVLKGAARHRIALMCAERQPERCHRTLLVAQALDDRGVDVRHIDADGGADSHASVMDGLLRKFSLHPDGDLLRSQQPRRELVAEAIARQSKVVGHAMPARKHLRGPAARDAGHGTLE